MTTVRFAKWNGPEGLEQHIINQTGAKPYSGIGIHNKKEINTAILRSVDNTYYYKDDFSDVNNIKYTLFGKSGDQNENEKRCNKPLLDPNIIENI